MQELIDKLGRPVKPRELATVLGIDARTVRKYYRRWGGIEVSPGTVRFFENRIKEVLHAEFSNEARQATLPGHCVGGQSKRTYQVIPGRQRQKLPRGDHMGTHDDRGVPARAVCASSGSPNRHGVFKGPRKNNFPFYPSRLQAIFVRSAAAKSSKELAIPPVLHPQIEQI
jgi:hypothetical protein